MAKKSLERRISELIATFGLDAVAACVHMAVELQKPRAARKPTAVKKAAAATPVSAA